nr:leucine rich repeat family protein [uncultured bacterium]
MRHATFVFVITIGVAVWADEPVRFADENLKAAVERQLDITNPTPTDLRSLKSLTATGGIVDLTGIEPAVNLVTLQLSGNRIRDLKPLSKLTRLEHLSLSSNKISDIRPLSKLTNLVFLDLHRNKIADVSPVAGLTKLLTINFHINRISDLSPVANLTKLVFADFHNNRITDIAPMSDLYALVHLNLADNAISDISVIRGFEKLRYLHLGNNRITDISPLSKLPNLKDLFLYGNTINGVPVADGIDLKKQMQADGGEGFTVESAKQTIDRYLAELEEISRVAAERKAEAWARFDRSLTELKRFEAQKKSGKLYHGMLGSYYSHKGRLPFIMLSVPNGTNVLSEKSREMFNARYAGGTQLYKFESRGHVMIPRSGSYRLTVSRAAGIKLNDVEYAVGATVAGEPPYADVKLTRGVYEVVFDVGNNGGQMNYSMVRITDLETGKELPIFLYESDLKTFTGDLSFGIELLETSGWESADNEIR